MKTLTKLAALGAASALILGLTACGPSAEYQERKESQSQALEDSLSRDNQEERLKREEDESQVRYVYILAPLTGEAVGYYTVNGKVSSAGVQNAPENDIIQLYSGGDRYVVDSAKDDGTYGPSETGFFFFTTENVLIEIEGLAYVQSDSPIRLFIDAPLLNEQ
ncbi:hypothetical protein SEA_BIG4_236 [Microbacterium phage Big4]|nr:hypothetical protein SEA_BIG4_236 [Microbacterium phage Big4]